MALYLSRSYKSHYVQTRWYRTYAAKTQGINGSVIGKSESINQA